MPAPSLATKQRIATDRRIARAIFVFVMTVILAGFARNFYLRAWFGTRELIPTAWLHGIVMSLWLMLFAIQVGLVACRRVDLHRKVGVLGAGLAVLIFAVGVLTIVVRARIAIPGASLSQLSLLFVAFDGLSLLLFAVLVVYALRQRARSDLHRRAMTMAMVALLPPAFGRLVAYVAHDHIEILVLGLMCATVLVCVAIDSLRSGRVYRISLVPGLLIMGANVATYLAQVAT